MAARRGRGRTERESAGSLSIDVNRSSGSLNSLVAFIVWVEACDALCSAASRLRTSWSIAMAPAGQVDTRIR
jgi:hypothetical protein